MKEVIQTHPTTANPAPGNLELAGKARESRLV